MRSLLIAAVAALVLGTGGGAATATTTVVSTKTPRGLTERGRVLWQFEALLHDMFESRPVCSTGRWSQRFTSGRCAPLAVYSPYVYTFVNARNSAFHISSRRASNFGNYPQPVLIRGRNIACNKRETTFLVAQVNAASFTLFCSRAGWTSP